MMAYHPWRDDWSWVQPQGVCWWEDVEDRPTSQLYLNGKEKDAMLPHMERDWEVGMRGVPVSEWRRLV